MCCEGMLRLKEGSGSPARLRAQQSAPPGEEKKRGPELAITYGPDIITFSEILVPTHPWMQPQPLSTLLVTAIALD